MMAPPIGKRNTRRDQPIFGSGGRLDLTTSTGRLLVRNEGNGEEREERTPYEDINDQHDEAQHTTACAVLPCVGAFCVHSWGCEGQSREAELEEEGEHLVVCFVDVSVDSCEWYVEQEEK